MDVDRKVVQHVNRVSSDQLLRKFAEDKSEEGFGGKEPLALTKVRPGLMKRLRRGEGEGRRMDTEPCGGGGGLVVERRMLLSPVMGRSGLLIGKSRGGGRARRISGRDCLIIRSKSVIVNVQKTWRKTVRGTSKMLFEEHYNWHKRLINDTIVV